MTDTAVLQVRRFRREIVGGLAGLTASLLFEPLLTPFSATVGFSLTALAYVFGAGALVLVRWERQIPLVERCVVACAIGMAVTPNVIALLSICHAGPLSGPLAFMVSGAMAARWSSLESNVVAARVDSWTFILVPLAVVALVGWASYGRFAIADGRPTVYGDYETFDLTFYAGIASGLPDTTVFPPASPFYAGHRIVHSYFPMLLLAHVHRTSGVSLLQAFLWFGWPFFGGVAAGGLVCCFRRLGSTLFAAVSTLLVFSGSTLAYLAAWRAPTMVHGDPLIWSSMFMAPSAEWLFFNPWAPALASIAAGLYATTWFSQEEWRAWALIAGICFGASFMFKSFGLPVLVAASLIVAGIALVKRSPAWKSWAATAVVTILSGLPWVIAVLPYNRLENRGAQVSVEPLTLVRRMLLKTELTGSLADIVHKFVGEDPEYRVVLTIASLIFLIGGLGPRCLGLKGVWRAAIGSHAPQTLTAMAWIAIIGIALSFVVAVAPFPNSLQTYLLALYFLWPFAVAVIWPASARSSVGRWIATVALVLVAVPSTAHYVIQAHRFRTLPPFARLEASGQQIIDRLRNTNRASTLMLQSDSLWASLYTIETERKTLLAWSGYVEETGLPDVDALKNDIARFFGSPDVIGVDDVSLLKRYHVTHVIERTAIDRLHPHVREQLRLLTLGGDARLYEVPLALRR